MSTDANKETLHEILTSFRELKQSNREMGDHFEKLMVAYFRAEPLYADRFSDVWLWSEWPNRFGEGQDVGIDIVAREALTGEYCAIQCKFYLPSHSIQKSDIDSFFTASGKRFPTPGGDSCFSSRIVVSTSDKWSKHAENALSDQSIPCTRIRIEDLEESAIDWNSYQAGLTRIEREPPRDLREHQEEALEGTRKGFLEMDRGKLIMACGTGKTFTALKIMEDQTSTGSLVLFLVPSLSLLSQTLREWSDHASEPFHAFAVCSDSKIGKDQEDISTHDLAYPATTDARKLVAQVALAQQGRRTIIFSTYQSIQVVSEAQKAGMGEFDLIICDEAHRTTGLTLAEDEASNFTKVHENVVIAGRKRLYMTATPRIFNEASKTKAEDKDAVLYSMDDPDKYGEVFYRIGFDEAVRRGILTDYKVLIVAMDEELMAQVANETNDAFQLDGKLAIDTKMAVRIIGAWKGLSKKGLKVVGEDGQPSDLTEDTSPMKRAVAFSRTIKASQLITDIFDKVVHQFTSDDTRLINCELDHVDGGMNALVRSNKLNWLKESMEEDECRILSNARCLSEGVDVPSLDSVVFFDTRESMVDIVQSVGRVMRRAEGKQYGYIILPVGIPSSQVKDYNNYIDKDGQFKSIWKVLKALRAHDESLVDEAEFRKKVMVAVADRNDDDREGDNELPETPSQFQLLPVGDISKAVYAAIPAKLGDREYWSNWAKDIANVAERLIERLRQLVTTNAEVGNEFQIFVKGLQDTLNPDVSDDDAIEMLAQHILTLPVFKALFAGEHFPDNNAVAKSLQVMVAKLDAAAVDSEIEGLEKFYENVRERVRYAKSDKSKQDIIRNLYDTFFNAAFPRLSDKLGIVYTPVEVVDFILNSTQQVLKKHFNTEFGAQGVHVLDPFSGTGTFLVRLLQSGLIDSKDIERKFDHELHANELVLLAYYIATVNMETALHAATGLYKPYNGMVLIDTFQMTEGDDIVDKVVLPENNERAERQLAQPIQVIVGNPPYSAGQTSTNDNNQNNKYPSLDRKIESTYVAQSTATNKNSLYDSYIRGIRWASDRIEDKGIVAFVTNGSFLDSNVADGLRKTLTAEYSHLYVLNMRGNARTSGEERRKEGGGVFNEGSRTPVAITLMVKDPEHQGECQLLYHDIGDYLTRKQKLDALVEFSSINSVPWKQLTPNEEGDWINQRDPAFEGFTALSGSQGLFDFYCNGVQSNRDPWVCNYSSKAISKNTQSMIETYNQHVEKFADSLRNCANTSEAEKLARSLSDKDEKNIKWTETLYKQFARLDLIEYNQEAIGISQYRPYAKHFYYYSRPLIHRYKEKLLPNSKSKNIIISISGLGGAKDFSSLVTSSIPDVQLISNNQCFPLYWYEKAGECSQNQSAELFKNTEQPDKDGYVRREAITDWALHEFRKKYHDDSITKLDIFWYVYGIFHSSEYKGRFESDLKKVLPRIPFARDFWAFSNIGKQLGEWHLNYESIEPYPLTEEKKDMMYDAADWHVKKMTFAKVSGRNVDKSVIHYNSKLTLRDIPSEAYEYIVNGKSAIEWIMERYAVTVENKSGISNNPNDWCAEHDDPEYIVNLIKRVVRVSVETVRLVRELPPIYEIE